MNRIKLASAVAGLTSLVASTAAMAQATTPAALDFSPLTDAIDVTSTIAAILSVGGVMVLVALAVMGVRKVMSMARG